MKTNTATAVIWCFLGVSLAYPQTLDETLPRNVTVTAIPGVIESGAKWVLAWQGADNADGLLGLPDGSLLFAQEQPSTLRRLDGRDFDAAYVRNTNGAGSVAMDSRSRLIAAQRTCTDPGRGDLPCTDPAKISVIYPEDQRQVLADSYAGQPLGRPNDLVVGRNGVVYFTDGGAYYVKPGAAVVGIGDDLRTNGIMLSPDETTLYVTNRDVIVAFDVAADGSVSNRRNFVQLPRGNGDGMAVDSEGRLYVATQSEGIQVFGPGGTHLGTIPTPRDAASIAFAGPEKKTLYATGRGGLAPNGKEFLLADGYRNNMKSIYKIPTLAQGYMGRPK